MLKFYVILINLLLIKKCLCQKYESANVKIKPSDLKLDDNNTDFISFPENVDFRKNFYHSPTFHQHNHDESNHHNHDHHTDEYHSTLDRSSKKYPIFEYEQTYHKNDDDDDDVQQSRFKNNSDEGVEVGGLKFIPLDFMRKFNTIGDVNDLLVNFVDEYDDPALASRFGGGEEERNSAVIPQSAACMPELQTVRIAPEADPSILYIPTCTRVERCGGCCSHSLLSCQPMEVETVPYQLIRTEYTKTSSKLKYAGKEIVFVEKHKKCKCDCKVQKKDCSRLQIFREAECRCVCGNIDEERKCYENHSKKLWNPDVCACQCRDIQHCTTGFTFDTNTCRCVSLPMRRRYVDAQQERSAYISSVPDIVPLYIPDDDN